MKNLLKLFGITLFLSSVALFTACNEPEEGPDLITPSDLAISRPAVNIADLSWNGSGESFEVEITVSRLDKELDKKTITGLKEKKYRFENAEFVGEGYDYIWSVRAKKGNEYTEWVKMDEAFHMYDAIPSGSSVEVTFKNRTWLATNIIGYIIRTNVVGDTTIKYDGFQIIGEEVADGYATVNFRFPVLTEGTTMFTEMPGFSFDYYESTFHNIMDDIMWGDWRFYADDDAYVTISSYDDNKKEISGEVKSLVYNTKDLFLSDSTTAANTQPEGVVIKFTNVKMTDLR